MKYNSEFKIGFWTILAIAVLVFGIQYLKGINSLKLGQYYYISSSNVEGLANSGPVKINGLQVGLVRSIFYDNANPGNIIVEINIEEKSLRLPSDTKAFIQSDLLGTSSVVLQLGSAQTYLTPRDTIAGGEKLPSLLDAAQPVIPAITQLIPKIDSLICGVNVLVNESRMHESLLEINTLTSQLNATVATLNSFLKGDAKDILANVNSITSNVDTLSSQIKEANIDQLLAKANQTLEQTNTLLRALASEEGTAGKIINSTQLHDQLTHTIASVDSLVNDIQQNPKRYINIKVFGK